MCKILRVYIAYCMHQLCEYKIVSNSSVNNSRVDDEVLDAAAVVVVRGNASVAAVADQ